MTAREVNETASRRQLDAHPCGVCGSLSTGARLVFQAPVETWPACFRSCVNLKHCRSCWVDDAVLTPQTCRYPDSPIPNPTPSVTGQSSLPARPPARADFSFNFSLQLFILPSFTRPSTTFPSTSSHSTNAPPQPPIHPVNLPLQVPPNNTQSLPRNLQLRQPLFSRRRPPNLLFLHHRTTKSVSTTICPNWC